MKIIAKLIKNEIFSLSTILFVVIPFAMSLANPQTDKSPLDTMQASLYSAVQAVTESDFVADTTHAIEQETKAAIRSVKMKLAYKSVTHKIGNIKPATNRPVYYNG